MCKDEHMYKLSMCEYVEVCEHCVETDHEYICVAMCVD